MSLEVNQPLEVREMVSEKVLLRITVFLGEFLASAFLMFVGCLGSVDNSPYFIPSGVSICLTWGIAVMIGINSFGVVSGGFMTPIITLAAFVHKVIDLPVR
jgi:aquaporin related protein